MEIRAFYDEYLATFVGLCRGDRDDVEPRSDGSQIAAFSAFYLVNDLPEGRRITTPGFRAR